MRKMCIYTEKCESGKHRNMFKYKLYTELGHY
jgi:hypothetical protein